MFTVVPNFTRRFRIPFLFALAFLAVSLLPLAPAGASPATSLIEGQLMAQLNNERSARGLTPMQADSGLTSASRQWSDAMANGQVLQHSGGQYAEIIAYGYWSGQITDAWMNSSGHRNLMVDPNLRWAGVGVTCDSSGRIWATIQFRRLDTTKATLSRSSLNPIATPADSGSGCGSDPYVGGVQRLYAAFFRRDSDPGGLAYWTDLRSRGYSLDVIADVFADSKEFRLTYGSLSNREFIDLIYRNVLRRVPDAEGYSYWVSQLDRRKLDRGQLMVQFSESPEFRNLTGISD